MTDNLTTKEMAKKIRMDLKKEFGKNAKFSVTSRDNCINIIIKEMKKDMFRSYDEFEKDNISIKLGNPLLFENPEDQFHENELTSLMPDVLNTIEKIGNKYNWNRSDVYTDYFDVNYYLNIRNEKIKIMEE